MSPGRTNQRRKTVGGTRSRTSPARSRYRSRNLVYGAGTGNGIGTRDTGW